MKMAFEWVLRLLGYALTAGAAPYVTAKYGAEAGAAVGGAGGFLLHRASQSLIPQKTATTTEGGK